MLQLQDRGWLASAVAIVPTVTLRRELQVVDLVDVTPDVGATARPVQAGAGADQGLRRDSFCGDHGIPRRDVRADREESPNQQSTERNLVPNSSPGRRDLNGRRLGFASRDLF